MKNIGFVSHDKAVRMVFEQLKGHDEHFNFYEIDDKLEVIDQYAITYVIFDFNNFKSLEDSFLYQRLNQRSKIRFFVIGNEISELLHDELKNNKVIAHLQKPVSSESLYRTLKAYLLNQNNLLVKEEQVKILHNKRFYSCLLGYYFLNKAVQYCCDNHVDESVRMAVIYDYIAVNYHTTKSDVEKSIRTLIAAFKHERHWTNSETILYFYAKQTELHQ